MTIDANLVCWHCGKQHAVSLPHPPQFAFELAGWASDVGLFGAFDMYRGRALVFCNEDHANAEKTKSGQYRARPKGPAKEPTNV
jgi:hypothetical protein